MEAGGGRGGGGDMKSTRQSCICGLDGLCESISKIIHFAVEAHFRLPFPITGVSSDGDRAGRGVAWGRFCLICHQRPGDPHPFSCSSLLPPSALFIRLTSEEAYIKKERCHCSSWVELPPHWGRQCLHRHTQNAFCISVCINCTSRGHWSDEAWNPCRSCWFVNFQIQTDYCVSFMEARNVNKPWRNLSTSRCLQI